MVDAPKGEALPSAVEVLRAGAVSAELVVPVELFDEVGRVVGRGRGHAAGRGRGRTGRSVSAAQHSRQLQDRRSTRLLRMSPLGPTLPTWTLQQVARSVAFIR